MGWLKIRCIACRRKVLPWWAWYHQCDRCRYWLAILRAGPPEEAPFPDPLDEEEPDDIEDCGVCEGRGEVVVLDADGSPRTEWETGALVTTECVACQGSGNPFYPWRRVA